MRPHPEQIRSRVPRHPGDRGHYAAGQQHKPGPQTRSGRQILN